MNIFEVGAVKKLDSKEGGLQRGESLVKSAQNWHKSYKSRKILNNDDLFTNIGFDTAENEPSKVCLQGPHNTWIRYSQPRVYRQRIFTASGIFPALSLFHMLRTCVCTALSVILSIFNGIVCAAYIQF